MKDPRTLGTKMKDPRTLAVQTTNTTPVNTPTQMSAPSTFKTPEEALTYANQNNIKVAGNTNITPKISGLSLQPKTISVKPEVEEIRKDHKGLSEKELKDAIDSYNKGTWGANYTLGDLQIKYNDAMSKYYESQDEKDFAEAEAIREKINRYQKYANNVNEGNWITKDFAAHVPQLLGQTKAGIVGAGVGAATGAATGAAVGSAVPGAGTVAGAGTGALWGAKAGYVGGVAKFSYDQMRGNAYAELLNLGVPNDIALKVSNDTALWQSIIEGAGAGVDLATLGVGKLFGKGAKTGAQLTAKKMIMKALEAYGINLASEFGEEAAQEKIAIEGEKKALAQAGIERTSTNKDDWKRIGEAGLGGFKIALVTGGGNVIGNVTVNTINNATINSVNKQYDEYIDEVKKSNLTETQKQEMIADAENGRQDTMNAIQQQMEQTEGKKVVNVPNTEQISQNNVQNVSNLENTVQNDTERFAQQVEEWKNNKWDASKDLVVLEHTPQLYQDLGLRDLPITLNPSKLNSIYYQSGRGNQNYHGLEELVKQIPEALKEPLNIVESNSRENSIVVVTSLADKNGNIITVPIAIDEQGNLSIEDFLNGEAVNKMTSAYGRENYDYNVDDSGNYYDGWMEDNLKNNRIVYDIDEGIIKKRVNGRWLQLPNAVDSLNIIEDVPYNNIIPNSQNYVNNQQINFPTQAQQQAEQEAKRSKLPTQEQQNQEQEEKVAELLKRRPEKQKKTLKQHYNDVMSVAVNKGHIVDQLAKKSGNKELSYKYDRMLSSANEGHYVIGEKQTDNKGNIIGKSINEIWAPVEKANKVEEFSEYLLHKLNIERMKQGKPVFGETVTADDSKRKVAEIEKENPEFIVWSKDVNKFNKNQLQNMVDAGLTSKETQELLNEMYDNYIRISRQVGGDKPIVNNKGKLKVNSPIKKAKGGNQDILPLKDSMAQQAIEVKKAISRNTFGLELLNTLKNGTEVAEYGEILQHGKKGEAPTFTVFKDGKPITMEINEELYNAIKPSERANWEDSIILNGLQGFTKYQKAVLTNKNIVFAFTNAIKDFQTAIVNSKDSKKMLKNYAYIVANKYQKMKYGISNPLMDYYEQLYLANGGETNTYFDYEKGALETAKEKTKLEKVKGVPKNILKKIGTLNEVVEQAPRLAEFITTLDNKGSINEAMYNAADITTNFKRGGELTKILDRNGFSFLNASIQGLDKQIRNITGQNGLKGYANLVIKFALTGVTPAILNYILLAGDEDYEELPNYIKDNYWLIKYDDDRFIRIPKGRDFSSFIGTVFQRTVRAIRGEENAFDGLAETFTNNLAPNNPLTDNVFSGIGAIKNNKAWHGGEIVSESLDSKISEQQYDAKTTEFAKGLAKVTNKINNKADWLMWDPLTSPKKIDYLVDQYTGGIGDFLMPMNTKYAEENNMFSAKFVTDSINNNKNISEFYDLQDELTKKKSSDVISEEEKYQLKYLSDLNKKMSDLYKSKREIENQDMKDEEKRKKANDVQKQINSLAKQAVNTYKQYGEIANKYLNDKSIAEIALRGTKEDTSEETKQENIEKMVKLYTDREVFGAEYALKEYNKKLIEKQKESKLDADTFFEIYFAQKGITGDKNKITGKTQEGSEKENKIQAMHKAVPKLTPWELNKLYDLLN